MFENCTNIKEIIIPETIQSIGAGAFYNCLSLKRIYFNGNKCDISDSEDTFVNYIDTVSESFIGIFYCSKYSDAYAYAVNHFIDYYIPESECEHIEKYNAVRGVIYCEKCGSFMRMDSDKEKEHQEVTTSVSESNDTLSEYEYRKLEERVYNNNTLIRNNSTEDKATLNHYLLNEELLTNKKLEEVEELSKDITADCETEMEKLQAIHDWVATFIYYDYYGLVNNTTVYDTWNVYEKKGTICEGYANLTAFMCRSVGIPCKKIHGYALGAGTEGVWTEEILEKEETNHAWNEAYVDGRWVILDTTWDSKNKNSETNPDAITYEECSNYYFDIGIEDFSKDHLIMKDGDGFKTEEGMIVKPMNLKISESDGNAYICWDFFGDNWKSLEVWNSGDYVIQYKNTLDSEFVNCATISNQYSVTYTAKLPLSLFTGEPVYFRIYTMLYNEPCISETIDYTLKLEERESVISLETTTEELIIPSETIIETTTKENTIIKQTETDKQNTFVKKPSSTEIKKLKSAKNSLKVSWKKKI